MHAHSRVLRQEYRSPCQQRQISGDIWLLKTLPSKLPGK
jgi:hypothetical protein